MDCASARERLVALQDHELSPGETVLVGEHLETCAECRSIERRLAKAQPAPFAQVSEQDLADIYAKIDAGIAAESARKIVVPPPAAPSVRAAWLDREWSVSGRTLALYAALLVAALLWGLHGALAPASNANAARVAVSAPPVAIPADQFEPAAYEPEAVGPELTDAPAAP